MPDCHFNCGRYSCFWGEDMITRIEALNYRSLRYVAQDMSTFHALIGPNSSGKTTFLDVVYFLHDLVLNDVNYALDTRSVTNFEELLWRGEGHSFELAIEAAIPARFLQHGFTVLRYEVQIGTINDEPGIIEERLFFKEKTNPIRRQLTLFPQQPRVPASIFQGGKIKGTRAILTKSGGLDRFYVERNRSDGKGWFPTIKLGPKRAALSSLYEDESKLPASLWFKQLITDGVQSFVLDSSQLRRPSPPTYRRGFRPDGSNLPWMISDLQKKDFASFNNWIEHIRTALPDIETVSTTERLEDRHRYLSIHYSNGHKVPSWLVSDGTLRLLALTLPAYISDITGIYLIEEPENGIHPSAMKTVTDSLQSIYGAQVFLATHSPVVVSELRPEKVLCFGKTSEGSTDIIRGTEHPKLKEWQGSPGLDTLFAGGVL